MVGQAAGYYFEQWAYEYGPYSDRTNAAGKLGVVSGTSNLVEVGPNEPHRECCYRARGRRCMKRNIVHHLGLPSRLLRHFNLIMEIGTTYPEKQIRWGICDFCFHSPKNYNLYIEAFIEKHRANRGSSLLSFFIAFWWTITYTFAPTIRCINTTFARFQYVSVTIVQICCQVPAVWGDMRYCLCVDIDKEFKLFQTSDSFRAVGSSMCVCLHNIKMQAEDQGSQAKAHLYTLKNVN